MIREIQFEDINAAYDIWNRCFKDEFEFPNFLQEFLCAFTVEEDGKVIAVAGIKPILESIIVVDQECSPRIRAHALYSILDASEYMGKKHGFNQLHAFIQNEKYLKTLLNRGFEKAIGTAVVRHI